MFFTLLKRALMLMACTIIACIAQAQNISVVGELTEDPTDQTANTTGTIKTDLNDKRCAIIKVETTQRGLTFEIGTSTAITAIEEQNDKHPAEVWLWVSEGTRKLKIQHAQLGVCNYSFPLRVKGGMTYLMKLATGKVQQIVEELQHQQFLKLRVEPKTANVTIGEKNVYLDADGLASEFLEFGDYTIRCQANNYHPYVMKYTINKMGDEPQELTIRMKPAFGWITIKDSTGIAGARVLIDDEEIGVVPVGGEGLRTENLKSGQHRIRVERKLYSPFVTQVMVQDSVNTIIFPKLEANFATTKVMCADPEADIYINKEKRGRGTWSGPLETGSYQFEARRPYHRNVTRTFSITKQNMGDDITLDSPTPINGQLRISSNPLDAAVEIDGKSVGSTPIFKSQILTGPHKLRFTRAGYMPVEMTIDVTASGITEVNPSLSNQCSFAVNSNADNLKVNVLNEKGVLVASGHTPFDIDSIAVGKYTFKAEKDGYAPFEEVVECRGQGVTLNLKATRRLINIYSNTYIPHYASYIDGKSVLAANRKSDRLYQYELDYGVHSFKINSKRSKGSKTFRVDDNSEYEIMVRQHYQCIVPNMFYIDLGGEMLGQGSLVGGAIGFNAANINVEASGFYPLGTKETFYYKEREGSLPKESSIEEEFVAGGRIGYALKISNRISITPQIGIDYHKFKFQTDTDTYNPATALSGTGGARVFLALTHHIGLQVSPQYRFTIMRSPDYKVISDAVANVKAQTKGFNLRAALVFYW